MSSILKKTGTNDTTKSSSNQKGNNENGSEKKEGDDKKNPLGGKGVEKDPSLPKVWRRSEVEILIKWGEIAACYRYLHELSFRMYQTQNYCFTMPVIIVSTLSGTASFSTTLFPVGMQPFVPMVVGMLNIGVGIVQTISQFLKIAEMSEGHRVAAIAYGKFSRNISTELSLSEQNRTYDGYEFVQICRSEIDRLIEQSPIIPIEVLQGFDTNSKFNNIKYKPDILGITPITEGNFDIAKKEMIQSANEKVDGIPQVNFSINALSSVLEIEKEKTKVDSEIIDTIEPIIPFEEERISNDVKVDIVSETTTI